MTIGVSNHYVIAAIRGAQQQGKEPEALLHRAGIKQQQIADPGGTVTPQQLSVLYKLLWIMLKDEFFGLGHNVCKLGYFRLMAAHHPRLNNLQSVLDYTRLFFSTTRDDVLFNTEQQGEYTKLIMTIDCASTDVDCFIREYHLIGWQRYLSWLIGYRLEPIETGFNFAATPHQHLYRYFFNGDYKFDQPTCHIVFHSRFLEYPIIRSHSELQSYLNSLPLPILYQPGIKQKYTALVENVISKFPMDNLPTLDQVA